MSYTLTVHADSHWVSNFVRRSMKLCVSFAVDSGFETNYNVVAYSTTVSPTIVIGWDANYSIAASREAFSNGAKFTAATTIQSISSGQSLNLPEDWTDMRPGVDPKARKNGFRFSNSAEASAIIYAQVQGNNVPIYISAAGPLPPGHEDITPKPRCRVWFARDAETGTMISDYESEYLEVDFTGRNSAEVQYDSTGTWINM